VRLNWKKSNSKNFGANHDRTATGRVLALFNRHRRAGKLMLYLMLSLLLCNVFLVGTLVGACTHVQLVRNVELPCIIFLFLALNVGSKKKC